MYCVKAARKLLLYRSGDCGDGSRCCCYYCPDVIDVNELIDVCLRWTSTTRHQRIYIYSNPGAATSPILSAPYQLPITVVAK